MPSDSFMQLLAEIGARAPCPPINVTLTNGNRLSLDDWSHAEDCLIERWPDGSPRYLVPLAQVVVIEIQAAK